MAYPLSCLNVKAVIGTTSATVGTQTTHAHGLALVPKFYLILPKGPGEVYQGASPNETNIYIKGSAASIPFTLIIFV